MTCLHAVALCEPIDCRMCHLCATTVVPSWACDLTLAHQRASPALHSISWSCAGCVMCHRVVTHICSWELHVSVCSPKICVRSCLIAISCVAHSASGVVGLVKCQLSALLISQQSVVTRAMITLELRRNCEGVARSTKSVGTLHDALAPSSGRWMRAVMPARVTSRHL